MRLVAPLIVKKNIFDRVDFTRVVLLILLFFLPACGLRGGKYKTTKEPAKQLTIMAASSLTEVFTELGNAFESEHPGVNIVFNFAGSQQLAQQLINGARADVYASANQAQMDTVVQNGRIDAKDIVVFAENKLVVVYPVDNPAKLNTLADLAKPGVKILLAAPEVPVGAYTITFLEKATALGTFGADFKFRVLANVVSYETTVKAVVVKVALGEADAGIVYMSDISPASHASLSRIEIPDSINVIAVYPMAPILDGQNDLAKMWVEFVQSVTGSQALLKYSFIPVH